jgi:hypothetical protein
MSQTVFYPDLKIVPIANIKLQEYVQKGRMNKLVSEIQEKGVLKNPPIVANFFNGTYLHLDGANRITALSILKYPNSLVQVVDYSDPSHVQLGSWSHLVAVDKDAFLSKVRKLKDVSVNEVKSFDHRVLFRLYATCIFVFSDGSVFEVSVKEEFAQLVGRLEEIVNLYDDKVVERVFSSSPWTDESIRVRFDRYSENTMFVAFPQFSPQQVISLVDRGVLMPPGITRHVVYRRKLNVNLPLEYLHIAPVEKANEKLQEFLQHRVVRLYEEPIIYFE